MLFIKTNVLGDVLFQRHFGGPAEGSGFGAIHGIPQALRAGLLCATEHRLFPVIQRLAGCLCYATHTNPAAMAIHCVHCAARTYRKTGWPLRFQVVENPEALEG